MTAFRRRSQDTASALDMSRNTIRRATLTDVPQLAEVFAAGFMDDDVFGRFMHPKRKEFPEDWLRWWNKEISKHIIDPAGLSFVGVDSQGTVKACCLMKKLGNASQRIAAEGVVARKLEQVSGMAQNAWDSATFTSRTADPEAIATFEKSWNDIEHYFTGPRAQTWFIELFCVHPEVQRGGGFGRDLIRNAIELGKNENPRVPVAVIASEIGDGFYEKYGFREVGRADVGDMSGVRGGSLKFYEEHL